MGEAILACLFGLGLITLLGHGCWVVVTAIFRGFFGITRPTLRLGRSVPCPRCQRLIQRDDLRCATCGLEQESSLAESLTDLNATERQLRRFLGEASIDHAIVNQLLGAILHQRNSLLGLHPAKQSLVLPPLTSSPHIQTKTPPVVEQVPEEVLAVLPLVEEVPVETPVWQLLEAWLTSNSDVRELSHDERVQAMRWFRASPIDRLAQFSGPCQLALARLLQIAEVPRDALAAYRRLLEGYPNDLLTAEAALEAARLAIQVSAPAEARWFLDWLLSTIPAPSVRFEAQELLRTLAPPELPAAPKPIVEPILVRQSAAGAVEPPREIKPAPAPIIEPVIVEAIVPEPVVAEPSRSFLEMLAAFMERSNILWGELVGGLLIVGCSIALVISQWHALEDNPVYQFGIFVGVTVSLFCIGLYTLHHWKLESTSRGLLIIATMLVPLNFLASAAQAQGQFGALEIVLELCSVVIFSYLLHLTAKILVPEGGWWFTAAIVGAAASQLLIPRILGQEAASFPMLLVLGCLPVACHGLGCFGWLHRYASLDRITERRSHALFTVLGLSTFSVCTSLGLLVAWNVTWGANTAASLEALAGLIAVAGLPLLSGGLRVATAMDISEITPDDVLAPPTDTTGETIEATSANVGLTRTIGTSIALAGMFVMLGAVALAWNAPFSTVAVAAFDFAILTWVAFRYRMPIAHAAALPCLATAYLTAFQQMFPSFIGDSLLGSETGLALVPLSFLVACLAEGLCRRRLDVHALVYIWAAGFASICGLTLVSLPVRGPVDPGLALGVYALTGLGALAFQVRWRQPLLACAGLSLLMGASLWGLWWQYSERLVLWGTVLSCESLAMGLLGAFMMGTRAVRFPFSVLRSPWCREAYAEPLARTAEGVAPLALIASLWAVWHQRVWAFEHVVTGSCLTALFLLLAAVEGRALLARLSGLALIGTFAVAAGWWGNRTSETLYLGQQLALVGTGIACSAALLTVVAFRAGRNVGVIPAGATTPHWSHVLTAWREISVVALGLALAFTLVSIPVGASALPALAGCFLVFTTLCMAWEYDQENLSWLASLLALGSISHALLHHPAPPENVIPWLQVAILCHASLALLVGLVVKALARTADTTEEVGAAVKQRSRRLYGAPLCLSALVSSFLALSVLAQIDWGHLSPTALCLFWLGAVWLASAWFERQPLLLMGFQIILCPAALLLTASVLESAEWFQDYPYGMQIRLVDPRSLQSFGCALGLLGLGWTMARMLARFSERARTLLESGSASVDRMILPAVVAAQAIVAVVAVWPEMARELAGAKFNHLTETMLDVRLEAFGWGAWALLALLTLVSVVSLWESARQAVLLGFTVLALTAPVLLAGTLHPEQAVPVALRWGLGFAFVVCSVPLWWRDELSRLALRLGCRIRHEADTPSLSRGLLLSSALAPILSMTLALAAVPFLGAEAVGPTEGSVFSLMGQRAAGAVPLLLLTVGLVGHAFRERSSGYAFSAGLVLNLAVLLGHALASLPAEGFLTEEAWTRLIVQLAQQAAVVAALWAIAWLAVRTWLGARHESLQDSEPSSSAHSQRPRAHTLLGVQVFTGGTITAALLGWAVAHLAFALPPASPLWTTETGTFIGWAALLLSLLAVAYYIRLQRLTVEIERFGEVGMAILGLLACSIESQWPGWGYRALMVSWSAIPLLWMLAAWRAAVVYSRREDAILPDSWLNATSYWATFASLLTLGLGLKAAFFHDDRLWAAASIALACPAWAILAVWQRREDRAFIAGLGVNLAASLIVWHFQVRSQLSPSECWVTLMQANVIASSAVALLWLGMRGRLYGKLELSLAGAPLLGLQVGIGLLGNLVLLAAPAVLLFQDPGLPLPTEVAFVGHVWGWLALALSVASAVWYGQQVGGDNPVHPVAGLGLGVGILTACLASGSSPLGSWFAYHVLTAVWTLSAVLTLVTANVVARLRAARVEAPTRTVLEISAHSRSWLHTIGALVLALALRGAFKDPLRPFASAGSTLMLCLLAAALADISRRQIDFVLSCVMANIFGGLLWIVWGPSTIESFLLVQVLCLSVVAAIWSAWGMGKRWLEESDHAVIFASPTILHASMLSLVFLSALAATIVGTTLTEIRDPERSSLPWVAFLATCIALGLSAAAHGRRAALVGWNSEDEANGMRLFESSYALGLIGLVFVLDAFRMTVHSFCWSAPLGLAPFFTVAAFICWAVSRDLGFWQGKNEPRPVVGRPRSWFLTAEACVACVTVALAVWISLDVIISATARLAGPWAMVLLLPGFVFLAESGLDRPGYEKFPTLFIGKPVASSDVRHATLGLSVLACAAFGWALVDDTGRTLSWLVLHRSVIWMVAVALMTVVQGLILSRILRGTLDWAESCRRAGPVLGVVASVSLLAVLAQEAWIAIGLQEPIDMAMLAVVLVAIAQATLIFAGLRFAVAPESDPFGLSLRGRKFYVYAAELLVVLFFLHLRLTQPHLYHNHVMRSTWPFVVMAIAFLGAGLSEWFRRRGLSVLAEPLERTGVFLPMLPILGFWALPEGSFSHGRYATVWMLVGLLYGSMSIVQRSFRFGLLAALAANMGLWVMLYDGQVHFLKHPQFWLIPVALIALVSEHLNRDRLGAAQSSALRYLALIVIYVSSAADMFLSLDQTLVGAMVLGSLSVLGVMSGMLLRIRAFLFLGISFLMLVILTTIWHAGVDRQQTWILWSSGIALGVLILAFFGVFEKRRNEILAMVEQLKHWS